MNKCNNEHSTCIPNQLPFITKKYFLNHNLTQYLFMFLSYKDLYNFAKANAFLFQMFKEFQHRKNENRINQIIKAFNLNTNSFSNINKNKFLYDSIKHKKQYVTNVQGQYLEFQIDKLIIYSLADFSNWTWKDSNYWQKQSFSNSLLGKQTPFLKNVCYLDTNIHFSSVEKGDYKLFIRQLFVSLKRNTLICTVSIGNNKIIYKEDFPSHEMFSQNQVRQISSNSQLKNQFLCCINENDFDGVESNNQNGSYEIHVCFLGKDQTKWKMGWFIDGIILEKKENFFN